MLLSLIARGMVYVIVTGCQRNGLCSCHWLPEEWLMLLSLVEQKQQQKNKPKVDNITKDFHSFSNNRQHHKLFL
jgi:hypothetical protein